MTQRTFKYLWVFLIILTGIIGGLLAIPSGIAEIEGGGAVVGALATLLMGVALVAEVAFLIARKSPPEE